MSPPSFGNLEPSNTVWMSSGRVIWEAATSVTESPIVTYRAETYFEVKKSLTRAVAAFKMGAREK
jgi:hypothetical protein